MSFFGDLLNFDRFWLRDLSRNIRDDPKRLLTGVDPASTKLWNKILGSDDEPLVNIFGGPQGGDSLGIGSGGVFDRAEAAGIDTGAANKAHDLAEIIAGFYAAQGLGGIGGGGSTPSTLNTGQSFGGAGPFASGQGTVPLGDTAGLLSGGNFGGLTTSGAELGNTAGVLGGGSLSNIPASGGQIAGAAPAGGSSFFNRQNIGEALQGFGEGMGNQPQQQQQQTQIPGSLPPLRTGQSTPPSANVGALAQALAAQAKLAEQARAANELMRNRNLINALSNRQTNAKQI